MYEYFDKMFYNINVFLFAGAYENVGNRIYRDYNDFLDIREKFSLEKTVTKLKAGIFIGPQIRQLMRKSEFQGKHI